MDNLEKYTSALKLLIEIKAIACGEKQVAENDSEGLHVIYKKIVEWAKCHNESKPLTLT